jgi:hypothetical protein
MRPVAEEEEARGKVQPRHYMERVLGVGEGMADEQMKELKAGVEGTEEEIRNSEMLES